MSRYQTPTPAPGDADLPDLIIRTPGRHAQLYHKMTDMLPLDLLQQQPSRSKTTPYEPTYSAIDKASCTLHDTAPASFILQPHHSHGLNLAYSTTVQQNDSTTATWPAPENPACDSCSKWSLACIHASTLNASDEHDSDSHAARCHAFRTVQQPVHLQKRHRDSEDARPRSQQHQKNNHAKLTPPMLRRWFHQSPRQECFSGVATAQNLSLGPIKSRL